MSAKVEVIGFSVRKGDLAQLLPNGKTPFVTLKSEESLDAAAERALKGAGVTKVAHLAQLETQRDGRTLKVIYYCLVGNETGEGWKNIHSGRSAGDCVHRAWAKLKEDTHRVPVLFAAAPKEFTLPELQKAQEAILQTDLDKRNFRKKLKATGLLSRAGTRREGNRGAGLYRFDWRAFSERRRRGEDVVF